MNRSQLRRAFTLVELLVVIAIIGVLVALLLPAVQAAREAARRLQCANHLRQIGLAALLHEDTHRFFPTGGWSRDYVGDPNRGFGKRQPGSWFYSVFPFLEENQLHQKGRNGGAMVSNQRDLLEMNATAVPGFHCPSRRIARPYRPNWFGATALNAPQVSSLPGVAKGDYAGNAGAGQVNSGDPPFLIPTSYTMADSPTFQWTRTTVSNPRAQGHNVYCSGIMYYRSEVKIRHVKDGTSKTYLVGEKTMDTRAYDSRISDLGDNQSLYTGFEWDNTRLTRFVQTAPATLNELYRPRQDTISAGESDNVQAFRACFGSAHAAGFNVVMCDGSTTNVSYDVDRIIHNNRGNREDGQPTSSE